MIRPRQLTTHICYALTITLICLSLGCTHISYDRAQGRVEVWRMLTDASIGDLTAKVVPGPDGQPKEVSLSISDYNSEEKMSQALIEMMGIARAAMAATAIKP